MKKTAKNILNILMTLLGNAVYALAIVMFVLPNGLITGGTTGLALTMEHFFGFPISVFVMIFNVSMFALGLFILGKKFAFTTLISTFFYPFILGVFQKFPVLAEATNDRMLATVCAGIMIGFGIGVVIKSGASTGGMDIPPLVLNKKFGLPVSVMIYVFDFTILILQMMFSNIEQTLYGILLVLIYTFVLDKILTFGTAQTQVKIISSKYKEINDAIIHTLDRGSSLVHITTGYLGTEEMMVLSVISNRELPQLKQIVNDIDPNAFLTISRIYETRGRGFSLQKKYIEQ